MADEVEEKLRKMSDFRTLLLTSIISALALVVGLFWNDAIKSAIEEIVPAKEGTFFKFVTAIFVTLLVVVIIYLMIHSQRVAEQHIRELDAERKRLLTRHTRNLKKLPKLVHKVNALRAKKL